MAPSKAPVTSSRRKARVKAPRSRASSGRSVSTTRVMPSSRNCANQRVLEKSRGSDGNASLPARRVPEASTSVMDAISGKLSASDARKTAHVRRGCNAAPGTIAHAVPHGIGSQFVCLENTQGMFGQGIAHIGDARARLRLHILPVAIGGKPEDEQRHEDRNDQKLWKRPLDHGKDATGRPDLSPSDAGGVLDESSSYRCNMGVRLPLPNGLFPAPTLNCTPSILRMPHRPANVR